MHPGSQAQDMYQTLGCGRGAHARQMRVHTPLPAALTYESNTTSYDEVP
jgi:hypothetical protein